MNRLSVVLTLAVTMAACGDSNGSLSPLSPSPSVVRQPDPTFTLSGVISRATSTGVAPLQDVEVRVGPGHVMTDGNGYYSISGLTPSSSIVVRKFGYQSERRNLTLSGDTRLDMQLVRLARYTLSGVVSELTPTGLVPVEGALVTGSFDYPTTTDKNGFFLIPARLYASDVGFYTYDLHVIKEGYQTYTIALTFTEDTRLEIQLVRR